MTASSAGLDDSGTDGIGQLDDEDFPAVTMGQAAQVLGVRPAFLRSLDAAGVLTPQRSEGGHRRYSRRQLALAARLRELFDEGLTLEAATRIVALQDELSLTREQLATARDELGVAQARELGAARDQLDAARARVTELESRTPPQRDTQGTSADGEHDRPIAASVDSGPPESKGGGPVATDVRREGSRDRPR